LLEQRAVDQWPVDQKRVGRKPPAAWTGVPVVLWKADDGRSRVLAGFQDVIHRAQDRPVVEDAVAGPNRGLAGVAQHVHHSDARRQVVSVNRVLLFATGKQWVVFLIERNDLEIVTKSEANGRIPADRPFVLRERLQDMTFDELVEFARSNNEPVGIGPRVRRIERRISTTEAERAILIGLRDASDFGVVVPDSELQIVVAPFAREKPRIVVLDLIVAVPRANRRGACLRVKTHVAELGRTP